MEALLDADSHALSDAVRRFIADEFSTSFDALSRRVFEYQYARNEAYRRFCGKRGVSPDVVASWRDVPAVPADAFKTTTLACAPAARVFRTSGTTRGEGERGTHAVVDDTIYDASVRAAFRRFVLPDHERMRILSLVPGVTEAPDSSLSAMADILLRAFGDDESGTYVGERRILVGALFAAMDRARHDGTPILLFGTTLAFADVLEEAARADRRFELPAGSRLVDTGGAKGSGRVLDEPVLVAAYGDRFGVTAAACVNEYGMTEILSQLYNDDLTRLVKGTHEGPVDRARKRHPHWMRVRVLDPDTLEEADEGVVCIHDLANCHSVSAILTEDLAVRDAEGFRLLGRRVGAGARGCSIAMDEWLHS